MDPHGPSSVGRRGLHRFWIHSMNICSCIVQMKRTWIRDTFSPQDRKGELFTKLTFRARRKKIVSCINVDHWQGGLLEAEANPAE